jgi:hypothetical protein
VSDFAPPQRIKRSLTVGLAMGLAAGLSARQSVTVAGDMTPIEPGRRMLIIADWLLMPELVVR